MIQLKKWVTYQVLEIIYKLYVRPHLDYGDILYHIANTNKNKEIFELFSCVSLLQQIESIQYQAAALLLVHGKDPPGINFIKCLDGNL